MKSFKWKKEKPNKGWVYPTSREGHTITYIQNHDCILLFGGLSNNRMNDLYLYDIKENQWKIQVTTGRSPSARCYHTAFYDEIQDNYYIYGGQGDKGRSMGDFYTLNMKNWIWKKLFIQDIPQSRHHHVLPEMAPKGQERIIFGGQCLPEQLLLNDVWVFNYRQIQANSSLQDISGAKCTQVTQINGQKPSPRRGMCSFSCDRQIFIFGGQTANREEETNVLYCLRYDTWTWQIIDGIGQAPPSRSFLSASVYTNRRIIFFGGQDNETSKATNEVNILTLNEKDWSSPFQAGMKASPRYHHSSCMIESTTNNDKHLVILGGLDFTFCSMEFCILFETETTDNVEWERLQEPTELDIITQEKAGLTIFNHKQYIDDLNLSISKERMDSIKLSENHQKLEEKLIKSEEQHKQYAQSLDDELQELDDQNNKYKQQMESIFLLIKQEQLFSKETKTKNNLLEYTVQKVQDYLVPLDQFYQQLNNMKYDEKDSKERELKSIVDGSKEEFNKSKDLYKESLYKLKKYYEKINQNTQKCEQDLEKNRKDIMNINKEYEQIICETETEEGF